MKKLSILMALLLCLVLHSSGLTAFAQSDTEWGFAPATGELEITADAVMLKNMDTGKIIYAKNLDKKIVPASLTKIMTAIIALESTENLDTETVIHSQAVADYIYTYSMEHGALSNGRMMAKEEFSMREMLYASLLPSANEAAMSIAEHIGGSQEAFVQMMNDRAAELGAVNTHFVNATGLHEEEHYTTVSDLMLLTEHALKNDDFKQIVGTYSYTVEETNLRTQPLTWKSTNEMQNPEHSYYYPPIFGVKTGTLPIVGRNFVSTASKDGFNYMLIIIGSEMEVDKNGNPLTSEQRAFVEAKAIYQWAFTNMRNKTIVNDGEMVGEVKIELSLNTDFVQAITQGHLAALVPQTFDITDPEADIVKTVVLPESLEAPIAKGDIIGTYTVEMGGEKVGELPLVAANSVEASRILVVGKTIRETSRTVWFKFAIIFIVLLIAFYIVLLIVRNLNKKRKRKNKVSTPMNYNKKD